MPPSPPDSTPKGFYLLAPHLPGSPTTAPVPSPTALLPQLELEPWPIRRQPRLSHVSVLLSRSAVGGEIRALTALVMPPLSCASLIA